MNDLYIIGNGFDLSHKIKTSYYDFKTYLEEIRSTVYEKIDRFLYFDFENEEDKNNVWNKFEYNLRNLDEDAIIEECSVFLMSYSDPDWRDSGHHDYQYCIDDITTHLTTKLLIEFTNWIKTVNEELHTVPPLIRFNNDAKFLTFNYTMTLERIYKIEKGQVLHIHNSIESSEELILGHNYSESERIDDENKPPIIRSKDDIRTILAERYYEDGDIRQYEGKTIIRDYYGSNYKDSNTIIKNNADFFFSLKSVKNIFVLGHSMTDVDIVYFIEILNTVDPKTHWYFTCHTDEDIYNTCKFIIDNKIENFTIGKITDTIFSIV